MAKTGKRITRVTTKAGDTGTTTLADGSKVPKTHKLMHAIGDVDELNSLLGLLVTELADEHPLRAPCAQLQQELFDLGAHLATVGMVNCPDALWLEALVTELNDALPATCRRAERSLWALGAEPADAAQPAALLPEASADAAKYANRLSDLLFVMARTFNASTTAGSEPQWRGSQGEPPDIA